VPEHSQTLATVIITSTSSRTTPPPPPTSAPSLVPNGSLFTGNKGEADNNPKQGKSAAGTVAGVIGGLSAAILLGVLAFFLWKWKTRGRYRFNKRSSFGPYGNGIDANRGDMLVSSVTCKAADSVSAHGESTCEYRVISHPQLLTIDQTRATTRRQDTPSRASISTGSQHYQPFPQPTVHSLPFHPSSRFHLISTHAPTNPFHRIPRTRPWARESFPGQS
jgi:hypothetical protein